MTPPLDLLFWLAVATLAARVCWEFVWAANHLQRLAATALRPAVQPAVVDLPSPVPTRRRRVRKPKTSYLVTMSPEDLDQLLGAPQEASQPPPGDESSS